MKSLDQIFDTKPSCVAFNLVVMEFFKNLVFSFQRLFSTFGDPAFCPAVFLHHSHQPTLVHSNSFWKHFMASSNWLLFVHYVPRLSFTTYFGSHQDFFVSICTVGHNIFSKLDSQLEHNAKSHELLPF